MNILCRIGCHDFENVVYGGGPMNSPDKRACVACGRVDVRECDWTPGGGPRHYWLEISKSIEKRKRDEALWAKNIAEREVRQAKARELIDISSSGAGKHEMPPLRL